MPPFKSLRGFMYPSVLCEFRKLYAYLISLLTFTYMKFYGCLFILTYS